MKAIPLTRGKFAIVNAEDFDILSKFSWFSHKCGKNLCYAETAVRIGKKMMFLKMHRMIMNDPVGFDVDHKNGNGLDNRRNNLRACSHKNNTRNRVKSSGAKSSQYKGVCFNKRTRTWSAGIGDSYHRIHIGYYATEIEAARAYDIKAQEFYGEYAKINHVDTRVIPKPIRRQTSSRYKGVYLDKRRGTWHARMYLAPGQYQYIGTFKNETDAAQAYLEATKQKDGGALSLPM